MKIGRGMYVTCTMVANFKFLRKAKCKVQESARQGEGCRGGAKSEGVFFGKKTSVKCKGNKWAIDDMIYDEKKKTLIKSKDNKGRDRL